MSEADRKLCPNCGHSNRATAKNCTQCGFAFFLAESDGILRKRCRNCGYMNRMGAKICSQCGTAFGGRILAPREHAQKWCPNCGARRRDSAKVCSFCGYRFKTPAALPIEPPVVQSPDLGQPATKGGVISVPKPPDLTAKPVEPPVIQSPNLSETVTKGGVISVPRPPDLRGEPAPFLSEDEIKRLRQVAEHRPGFFVRLYQVLRDDKP